MLGRIVRPVTQIARKGARQYHDDKPHKFASMDELPVPQGSWQASYDANQKKFNLQLFAGLAFFIGTVTFAELNGALYMNAFPPTPDEE